MRRAARTSVERECMIKTEKLRNLSVRGGRSVVFMFCRDVLCR